MQEHTTTLKQILISFQTDFHYSIVPNKILQLDNAESKGINIETRGAVAPLELKKSKQPTTHALNLTENKLQ